uniref:Uncharacterized protein n=1 Tax=Anguilla anguilla TaxID=7936 RepID=A0A0E9WW37_ANGAN
MNFFPLLHWLDFPLSTSMCFSLQDRNPANNVLTMLLECFVNVKRFPLHGDKTV